MSLALPSRSTRTAGVVLALALALSGCGAGLRAQNYQQRTTSDSTNEAIGAIAVRHIRVLPPTGGRESYPVGSDARVAFVLVNEGMEGDRLTSVTTDSASSVEVQGPGGRAASLTVPGQSSGISQYSFLLRGLTRELRPGQYVEMELSFAVNGTETMLVPVEVTGTPGPQREDYEVPHTDSEGNPVLEHGEGEDHSEEGGSAEEGAGTAEEGEADRPELDNDGGDPATADSIDPGSEPAGDEDGGDAAPTVPPVSG